MNTIVFVASRKTELTSELLTAVAMELAEAQPCRVRVRANIEGDRSSGAEDAVWTLTHRMRDAGFHVHAEMYLPPGTDRRDVFLRDYEMVRDADRVIAFFSTYLFLEGGTGHVVKAALDRDLPVKAFSLGEHGDVEVVREFGG